MNEPTLWRHAAFRRLYVSTMCFVLATQVYQLAMPLIFYELTHSATVMSGLRAVELLPNLLLAMFIGVWVDRIDRGRWARRALAGMVALMGVQALLLPRGTEAMPLFFACAFALMTLSYLYGICRTGLVKEMLPSPLLLPAIGQLSVIEQVAGVIGPAAAGALVAHHVALGLWVPMGALLLAAVLLRGLALPQQHFTPGSFWQDWLEGWRVLRANRPLWQLAGLVVLMNGCSGVVDVLFLFRARDQLHLGPAALGGLYAMAGLGGVAGGFLCSAWRQRLGLGRLLAAALALQTACTLVLAWGASVPVLVAGLAANSLAGVVGNVCIWGYRQESTASIHIGRVSGLTGSLFKLAMPFTLLLAGHLAGHQPLGLMLSACAAAYVVTTLGVRWSAVYRVI